MSRTPSTRTRRLLHPAAWWVWAGGLAAAAMRTTNPFLLALIIASVAFVVASRRQPTPWAASFGSFFKLGLVLIAFRLVLQILFGARIPGGHELFTIPSVQLPSWAAGVSIGGPVTIELLLDGLYSSLRLATVLVCFGAVNSLCSPYRLLRSLPAVLYEAGVVVTVALSFAPQAVMAVARVRDARRLRGRPTKGLRGVRGMAIPVLEDALERSVSLAASMDARGYGRRGDLSARARRASSVATAVGLLAVCVGTYALLDVSAPRFLALPLLGAGAAAMAIGLLARGRHTSRSRYRPDPWRSPEWIVSGTGVVVLAAFTVAAVIDPNALDPSVYPLVWPAVPLLPVAGIALALLPAWVSPVPPPVVAAPSSEPPVPASRLAGEAVAA